MTKTLLRLVIVLIATISLLRSAALAAGPKAYAITQLHQLSTAVGAYAVVSGINDNGIAVGSDSVITTVNNIPRPRYQNALTWDANGQPTKLTNPGNSPFARGLAINNAGLVAGQADSNTSNGNPTLSTVFTNGVGAIITPSGAANYSLATSVNNAGTIAGNESTSAYVYANGVKTFVGGSGGNKLYAAEYAPVLVSDAGKVYASGSSPSGGSVRPFTLVPGSQTPLYSNTTRAGLAFDVNRSETLVGQLATTDTAFGATAPAIFKNGTATLLPGLGGTFGTAYSINDAEVIVGGAGDAAFRQRAFRTIGAEIVDLNTLAAGLNGWDLTYAVAINNRGQIVCNASIDDDNNPSTPRLFTAFRLDPIRTPGDTNYDDAVNFTDLLTLARNYNKSGNGTVFWESGDFNYDWTINFDDLLTLAKHYQGATATASLDASFASDWALAQSLVPEPTTLAAIGGMVSLVMRRQRRACDSLTAAGYAP